MHNAYSQTRPSFEVASDTRIQGFVLTTELIRTSANEEISDPNKGEWTPLFSGESNEILPSQNFENRTVSARCLSVSLSLDVLWYTGAVVPKTRWRYAIFQNCISFRGRADLYFDQKQSSLLMKDLTKIGRKVFFCSDAKTNNAHVIFCNSGDDDHHHYRHSYDHMKRFLLPLHAGHSRYRKL